MPFDGVLLLNIHWSKIFACEFIWVAIEVFIRNLLQTTTNQRQSFNGKIFNAEPFGVYILANFT